MKILVLSDSHGSLRYMQLAIEASRPNYIIHLGDHSRDAEELKNLYPMLPITYVRGNCDFTDIDVPEQRLAEYDGVRILMSHGHRHGVKSTLLRYYMAAKENQMNVALFGHTHLTYCEEKDGLWLLNPGSCGSIRPTCGIIEISNGEILCQIKAISESEECK